jgi:hypothetical protein
MDDCKGCGSKCLAESFPEESIKCPCIICLIKVTCFDPCKDWHRFFYNFSDTKEYQQILKQRFEANI